MTISYQYGCCDKGPFGFTFVSFVVAQYYELNQNEIHAINNEQLFCIYSSIIRRVRGVFGAFVSFEPKQNRAGQYEYMGMRAGWS